MTWRALAVVAVLVGALIWALWPDQSEQSTSPDSASVSDARIPQARPSAPNSTSITDDADEALPIEPPPAPIDRPMTAKDGVLEVLVTAGDSPVSGASVTLYWRGERDPNTNTYPFTNAGSTQSGKDGCARLFARHGRYVVAAKHADYAASYAETYRPSEERVTKITIVLQRGIEVHGETVREEDAARIAMVDVVLSPQTDVPRSEKGRVRSDASGAFVIKGVAPGSYDIEARKEGEGSGRMRNVVLPGTDRLIVKLGASSFLNGYVRTSKADPAEGALVTAIGQREPLQTKTGRGGAFALEAPRGEYTLQALFGDETGAAPETVHVGSGKTVDGIEIKLGAPASISGRVTDASSGEPVMDARIDVSPYRENGDSGRARSDSDGRFTVRPLAPGSYDVVVQADGFSLLQRRGITLANGEQFELPLPISKPGGVRGTVVDDQGQGIGGARVAMNGAESRTAEDGRFSFEDVPPGTVGIRAWRENESGGHWTRVAVKSGETAEVQIVLSANAQLEVRIVDEANNVVTAGQFTVDPSKGANYTRKTLDGSASYTLTLASGTYRVVMRPTGAVDLSGRSEPIALEPNTRKSLTLVVKPSGAGVISGVVLGVDGAPASGANIRVEPSDPAFLSAQTYWRVTDNDGRFVLRAAVTSKPVTYSVRAWDRQGHNSARVPVNGELVLRLRPNGSLSGTVQGWRAGETLRIEYDSDTDDQTLEFAGANFSFRDVPAAEDATVRVVSSAGRKGEIKHVTITPGETTQLTLTLE